MPQYRFAPVVIVCALLAACSASKDMGVAENAVPEFHQSLDAGQFEQLYDDSSDDLKAAGKKADFIAFLEAIHRKLGKVKVSKKVSWNINFGTNGTVVSMAYETHFAEGDGTEQFVYRVSGQQASLMGYHINSTALIIK